MVTIVIFFLFESQDVCHKIADFYLCVNVAVLSVAGAEMCTQRKGMFAYQVFSTNKKHLISFSALSKKGMSGENNQKYHGGVFGEDAVGVFLSSASGRQVHPWTIPPPAFPAHFLSQLVLPLPKLPLLISPIFHLLGRSSSARLC